MGKTGIYIDHENIRIRLGELNPAKDIYEDDFISKLKVYLMGRDISNPTIFAYDNFEHKYFSNKNILSHYLASGINPVYSLDIKDSVDMELSLDAYESCINNLFDRYIIVSSDKDMFPLIKKLKSRSKQVYLVGVTFNASNYVIRQVDAFIPIEDIMDVPYDPQYLVKKDISIAVKRLKNLFSWTQGKGRDLEKSFLITKLKEELFTTKEYVEDILDKIINNGIAEEYIYKYKGIDYTGIKYNETPEAANIQNDHIPTFA